MVVGFKHVRRTDIALTIRRMFQQLTEPIAVALWCVHRIERLHDEQAVIFVIEMQLINHTARNHQVVSIGKIDVSQLGFERSATFMNEQDLIGIGILVKVIGHRLLRRCQFNVAIRVYQDGGSAC